ncbi:hypothetical protein PspLS_10207 [Pyricularia sp. CBS 133598]|nr:hypothetical protein PspLS_10207 [Pyricularia sp. CBS 133598]
MSRRPAIGSRRELRTCRSPNGGRESGALFIFPTW